VQVFEFVNIEVFQTCKFHNESKSLPPSTLDVQKRRKERIRILASGCSEDLLRLLLSNELKVRCASDVRLFSCGVRFYLSSTYRLLMMSVIISLSSRNRGVSPSHLVLAQLVERLNGINTRLTFLLYPKSIRHAQR